MENKLIVRNPSNDDVIAELVTDDIHSVKEKLTRACELFENKPQHLLLHQRVQILQKVAAQIESRFTEFASQIAEEGGKPLQDARVEVTRAIAGVHIAIQVLGEHRGNVIPLGHTESSAGRYSFTQGFPRGVVLAFSAFNHPLNLIIHQVIPAFAAGCPCIVKPAPDTPLSCIKLLQVMHESGVPKDYIDCVITDDLAVADSLVRSSKIAFFSFIGSAKVGWMLRSRLQPGVRCALEHGGVAPCIVTASANLDKAIPAIVKGGYYHAGQVCVSTQRVYVEQSVYAEFVERIKPVIASLVVGAATENNTEVGPLIRHSETERIHEWVEEARREGAVIATGGVPLQGNFYPPTLILNPPVISKISQQEIFGPVVCVCSFDDFDSALMAANIKPFAFQAAIFTEQLDQVYLAYERLDTSAMIVNDHTAFRDDAMPFAGLSASGLGVGGIPYTIKEMQFEKMLVLKRR